MNLPMNEESIGVVIGGFDPAAPYKLLYGKIDYENHYEARNKELRCFKKFLINNILYILTPKHHKKVVNISRNICSLISINIHSIKFPFAKKYDSSIWREILPCIYFLKFGFYLY